VDLLGVDRLYRLYRLETALGFDGLALFLVYFHFDQVIPVAQMGLLQTGVGFRQRHVVRHIRIARTLTRLVHHEVIALAIGVDLLGLDLQYLSIHVSLVFLVDFPLLWVSVEINVLVLEQVLHVNHSPHLFADVVLVYCEHALVGCTVCMVFHEFY